MRLLVVVLLLSVLAGCSDSADPPTPSAPTGPFAEPTPDDPDVIRPEPPEAWPILNETYDLVITHAEGEAGAPSVALLTPNCVSVDGANAMKAGRAMLEWDASPTTATLRLIAYAFPGGERVEVTGPSPLTLDFEFAAIEEDMVVDIAAQVVGPSAAIDQPATLMLGFTHPPGHEPDASLTNCGF